MPNAERPVDDPLAPHGGSDSPLASRFSTHAECLRSRLGKVLTAAVRTSVVALSYSIGIHQRFRVTTTSVEIGTAIALSLHAQVVVSVRLYRWARCEHPNRMHKRREGTTDTPLILCPPGRGKLWAGAFSRWCGGDADTGSLGGGGRCLAGPPPVRTSRQLSTPDGCLSPPEISC
jgi:hypothetical protein